MMAAGAAEREAGAVADESAGATRWYVCPARDQLFLLPVSMRDWLDEGHLAWFVVDVVDELDTAALHRRAGGCPGRRPYEPEMMCTLLLYAYCCGIRSSRRIEAACRTDAAFRVICGGLVPDHATIARFRCEHERALMGLFGQVLAMCRRAGLVKVGVVAVDSTKLGASASSLQNRSYEQIVEEILAEAAAVDAREDELYGEARGDELPEELADPRSRRARLKAIKRELDAEREAEQRARQELLERREEHRRRTGRNPMGRPPKQEPSDPPAGRVNVTDPDSRPVRTPRGFIQGYNAHAAVAEGQIIVAAEVTAGSGDQGHLEPVVNQAREQLDHVGAGAPEVVLADAGYWASGQVKALQQEGITILVPPDKNVKSPGRRSRGPGSEQMRERLRTEAGARLYAQRIKIEPVFGQTKHNRRIDRFHRRGLPAVRAEWNLITTTHNLLKLWVAAKPAIA